MNNELIALRQQLANLESLRSLLGDVVTDAKRAELGARIAALQTGGAAVLGDVTVTGDFVGRDMIVIHDMPPEDQLCAYYRSLAAECARLPLGVVDPRFAQPGQEGRVALHQIYVDLDVITPVCAEHEDDQLWGLHLARGEGEGRTAVLDALAAPEARTAILLGDAGSGKTTFVNYLTYLLADSAARRLPATGLPDVLARLWPVRLSLRNVIAYNATVEVDGADATLFWDALRRDVALRLGATTAARLMPYFQKCLLDQGGFFLLDGLDEVPQAGECRAHLLTALRDLAACLPAAARVLLTARPYAYADPAWQLANFSILTLAPFDMRQAAQFIEHWYTAVHPGMGWDTDTATTRGQQLLAAVQERPYLGDLASRPLLLTLMVTLHSSWGQLPEDRAALYEETVKLLLSRWQRGREVRGPDGKALWEPGIEKALGLGEDLIRAALERLAYESHMRQQGEVGDSGELVEAPADIPQSEVLAAFAPDVPDDMNPQVLVTYLEQRAGLLLGRRPGVYAFPHRSFQEYLAACYLTKYGYLNKVADLVRTDPNYWREVTLLAGARIAQGTASAIWSLVDLLCYQQLPAGNDCSEADSWGALLAAQMLFENRRVWFARVDSENAPKLEHIRKWQRVIVERGLLPPAERLLAGNILATLGDDRNLEELVFIPEDMFLMGSADIDELAVFHEKPQHVIWLPNYKIGKYLVTVREWKRFVRANPEYHHDQKSLSGFDNHPAHDVSWHDARAYCDWLTNEWRTAGKISGDEVVRLPSEAEWEKAASWSEKQGEKRVYPWGDEWDAMKCNIEETGLGSTSPVGMFPAGASPYMCLDMAGNVWEWTTTLWGKGARPIFQYPYRTDDGRENLDAADDTARVLRGGAFGDFRSNARCAYRTGYFPLDRNMYTGFRIVVSSPFEIEIRRFLEQVGLTLTSTDPFGFLCTGEGLAWATVAPLYARLVLDRPLDMAEFQALCISAEAAFGEDVRGHTALVIIDRTPAVGCLHQIFGLRAERGLTIVPLPRSVLLQAYLEGRGTITLREQIDMYIGRPDLYAMQGAVSDVLSFFGRAAILADLKRRLLNGGSVLLCGVRKIGKSSLQARLREDCRWPAAAVDLEGYVGGLSYVYTEAVRGWQVALATLYPDLGEAEITLPEGGDPAAQAQAFRQVVGALLERLTTLPGRPGLLLFLDEIDVLFDQPEYLNFAAVLRSIAEHPQWRGRFALLASGLDPALGRADRLAGGRNPFFAFFSETPLGPLEPEDVRTMIVSIGGQMGVGYTPEALELLIQTGGGHPFLTRQLCSHTVRGLDRPVTVDAAQVEQAIAAYLRLPHNYFAESLWGVDSGGPPAAEAAFLTALATTQPQPEAALIPSTLDAATQRAYQLALEHLHDQSLIRATPDGWELTLPLYRRWIRQYILHLAE